MTVFLCKRTLSFSVLCNGYDPIGYYVRGLYIVMTRARLCHNVSTELWSSE